jgi:hypothetical protein
LRLVLRTIAHTSDCRDKTGKKGREREKRKQQTERKNKVKEDEGEKERRHRKKGREKDGKEIDKCQQKKKSYVCPSLFDSRR